MPPNDIGRRAQRVLSEVHSAFTSTCQFYACLDYYIRREGTYAECPYFRDDTQARVHVYSLALMFRIWHKPHYRNGTFQQDLQKNLRNVAVPGTGIPLSLVCVHKNVALIFILVAYPLICLAAAVYASYQGVDNLLTAYREQLVNPKDWFSFWQLNCRLATWHAYVTSDEGYKLEDKLAFLEKAKEVGVPSTPYFTCPSVICKHRNEEGGLGYCAFTNALHGGDWIIQEAVSNCRELKALLPAAAPLSTLRLVTASSGPDAEGRCQVSVLSCVWRAGRDGALTDHSSVLFDVDLTAGKLRTGTTNAHWYQLGLKGPRYKHWISFHDIQHHPDTGLRLTHAQLWDPAAQDVSGLVQRAHADMAPGVPLIGWDVALTEDGPMLLEGNFSCNFFRGTFDRLLYFRFVDKQFRKLEAEH